MKVNMYIILHYLPLIHRLVHWDVNNEQEHGPWFEETLSDPTYMNTMFTGVRARDPNVILFLNEYEVVAGGYVTQVTSHYICVLYPWKNNTYKLM